MLRFQITMSADGYIAGPNQTLKEPLGEGGEALHEWAIATRAWNALQGQPGGAEGPDSDVLAAGFVNLGANIMGRNMFGGGPGPWPDPPWKGWWGENPPYHTPVFVLTHHPRPPLPMKGGTTFYFVTEGFEAALKQAREAAGDKDILIAGGANVAQQYLRAGLVDQMDLHVVPLLLGSGERLFEKTDGAQKQFQCVRVVATPAAAHYTYRRR